MNIKYDGYDLQDVNDQIVTFSEIPNILSINQTVAGTYATLKLRFLDGWQSVVTANTQYSITLFGETISNVMSPKDANNKKFFIGSNLADTAISVCRALRNCGSVTADFTVNTSTTVSLGDTVVIKARTIGMKFTSPDYIVKNVPSNYMQTSVSEGSADENDGKFLNSRIQVDVYQSDDYITTLEKNFYNNSCSFNVTPVLATMTEPRGNAESIVHYKLSISKLAEDGTYSQLGSVSGYTTYGYIVNNSPKIISTMSGQLLSSYNNFNNDYYLYTAQRSISYSVLANGDYTINFKVYNSAMSTIYTSTTSDTSSTLRIDDKRFMIPNSVWSDAFAVDVIGAEGQTMRFNVIKPLNMTEETKRIYWRNEHGGISFMDFTGQQTETPSISVTTYEKNNFDYYTNSSYEKRKIYKNEYNKKFKVKSHILQKNGKYIFDSLAKSKKIWISEADKLYFIIPNSLEITEDSNYNNLYTCSLEYELSDLT